MIKELLENPLTNKVYISGPITGIKDNNELEFLHYENKFKKLGFNVTNPHNLFSEIEKRLILTSSFSEKEKWSLFMKRDLPEMMKCDFVAVIPNWEKSEGVNLELYNAQKLQMPIICALTYKEVIYSIDQLSAINNFL